MRAVVICARCGNEREVKTRWLCKPCYETVRKQGVLEDYPVMRLRKEDIAEDIRFLDETGVVPACWPERIGRSAEALERSLYRAGEVELARAMSKVRREQGKVARAA